MAYQYRSVASMLRQTDEEPRRRGRAAAWIVSMLVVVFVLYPLSVGPATFLVQRYPNSPSAAITCYVAFYEPLWQVSVFTGTRDWLAVYYYWSLRKGRGE